MFRNIFGKNKDHEEEEILETIDPVIEQRRKEKFSTPLIFNDEVDEEEKEIIAEKPKKEIIEPKRNKSVQSKPVTEQVYRMSEIISPMNGLQEKKKPETKTVTPTIKKPKKENNGLIQIISPIYGSQLDIQEETEIKPESVKPLVSNENTVEENLRNIATIVEEEQDQLKIIEQRTGEFKLDFSSQEESLIDEIDDKMSLDELMNLYEKKFKD